MKALFGQDGEINLGKPSVEFDLAALVGKKVGFEQCQTVYARCKYDYSQLRYSFNTV